MSDEQEGQGFKVRDRRIFSTEPEVAPSDEGTAEAEAPRREAERPPEKAAQGDVPLPEASFSGFLTFFFFQQILMFLGDLPHPETQQVERNLPMAKYLIDTLGIIKQKTSGNLDPEERNQLDTLLTELRMRYVKAMKR